MVKTAHSIVFKKILLILPGLFTAPEIVTAFDDMQPEVINAYTGEASDAKRRVAFDGVEEILTFAHSVLDDDPDTSVGSVITISTVPAIPELPDIEVLTTITAGFDSDLAPFGNPVILDKTELIITQGFLTPRNVSVGANGAVIDTGGPGRGLAISGDFTADGTLLILGGGQFKLLGNATWNAPPFLYDGSLSGTTENLDTDINGVRLSVDLLDAPLLHFDQGFDGTLDKRIDGAMHLIKTGAGDISVTSPDNNLYGGSISIERGAIKLVGPGRLRGGDLSVASSGTFDISDATVDYSDSNNIISVSNLNGDGRVRIGTNALDIYQTRDTVFTGSVEGTPHMEGKGVGLFGIDNPMLTFTERQYYQGPTFVRDATLAYSGDGNWASRSLVMFNGTLDFSNAVPGYAETYNLRELIGFGSGESQSRVLLGPNDLTIATRSEDLSFFTGVISGSGGLTLAGTGTVILTGDNTYTGETWIARGRLIARANSLSDLTRNDSELELFQPLGESLPLSAYSGEIYGRGRLITSGGGVVWLRGNNSYTGGTTVSEGVLLGNVDSLPGDIQTHGFIGFYQINDAVFEHDISGDGGVVVFGPGELEFRGNNAYSGGTYFSGTIVTAAHSTLGAAESPLGFVGGTLRTTADMDVAHPVIVAEAGGILDTANFHVRLNGGVSGSGVLEKIGPGRLTLIGDNPGFVGQLVVSEGQASVSGSNSGSVEFSKNSELLASVSPDSASRLALVGPASSATIGGGTVSVVASPGNYSPRTQYALISASAGISGEFDQVSIDNPNLDALLTYGVNEVILTLLRLDFSFEAYAATPLQRSVSIILDQMRSNPNPDVMESIAAIDSVPFENLSLALESITAANLAGIGRAVGQFQRTIDTIVARRLNFAHAASNSEDELGFRGGGSALLGLSALSLSVAPAIPQRGQGAWLRGFGGTGSLEVSNYGSDLSSSTGGVIGGYDISTSSAGTIGILFGFAESGLDQNRPRSGIDIASWFTGSYGQWRSGCWSVNAMFSYADHSFNTRRTLALGPKSTVASADFGGSVVNGRINAGYRWGHKIEYAPYASIHVSHQSTDGYAERGAGAIGLNVDDNDDTSIRGSLGLLIEVPFIVEPERNVHGHAYLAWSHEFSDTSFQSAGFIGDTTLAKFAIKGTRPANDAASFGAGVRFAGTDSLDIFFGFDGEVDSTQHFVNANAGLRYVW